MGKGPIGTAITVTLVIAGLSYVHGFASSWCETEGLKAYAEWLENVSALLACASFVGLSMLPGLIAVHKHMSKAV